MDVGQRVTIGPGAVDDKGAPAALGKAGIVIGHLGKLAIVSLDVTGGTVLVPEGSGLVRRGSPPRPVVVKPDGTASPLTREGYRHRVRKPR